MRITWSVPVFSRALGSGRGDLVRAGALIEALRSEGHEVRVVEARERPGRELEESVYRGTVRRLVPDGVALSLRDLAWWWRSRGHGGRVAEAATEQGADVIVETQVHGVVSGAAAARSTGLPLVLDDVSPQSEAARLGSGLSALSRRAFRRQRDAAALLVAPSARARERVMAAGSPTRVISVLPNGIDLRAHRRSSREAGRQALEAGVDLVYVFVGSFQPWHEVPLLVRAFAGLPDELPARLLLVGAGPGREPSLSEARELGVEERVMAPGTVPPARVPEILAACDVGVLPGSNDYGHPMKLLEYAAAGLPVVAPDLAPVREALENGRCGLLFQAGDGQSLKVALRQLAESPESRRRFGDRARSRMASGAGWEERGRRLSRFLERTTAT